MTELHKDSSSEESDTGESTRDLIYKLFAQKLGGANAKDKKQPEKVIEDLSFDGLARHWHAKGFKNIVTMVGAGISTSAGIPDFRSDSGLYNNLQKYNLPHPMAIFELDYFKRNPKPFFALAKELYPSNFTPTITHYFVRLLHEKGLLVRHYTQNIDMLERIAGIPHAKLIEAHGTFHSNHCIGCRKQFPMQWAEAEIFADRVPTCDKCGNTVKPDIVFFGEQLPDSFHARIDEDFKAADLLIIMGTSLEVQPFASLIEQVGPKCVRLLINLDKVGRDNYFSSYFASKNLLKYDMPNNTRDVAYIGKCDDGVQALATELGWAEELRELMTKDVERLVKLRATPANDSKQAGKGEPAACSSKSTTEKEAGTSSSKTAVSKKAVASSSKTAIGEEAAASSSKTAIGEEASGTSKT